MTLADEIKADHDLFYSNPDAYKKKVHGVSNLLQLSGSSELMTHLLPTYLVGDYRSGESKYVLFGMNPGYNEKSNAKEESLKSGGWNRFENFTFEFFRLFKESGLDSKYYRRLAHLFAGIDNVSLPTYENVYDYYQKNLVSIDLVPYHSTSFGLPSKLSHEQLLYLKNRLAASFEFIATLNCKMVILHGALFTALVREGGYLDGCGIFDLTEQTKMYTFKFRNLPGVLFSRMITQPASGVTFDILEKGIPVILKSYFG